MRETEGKPSPTPTNTGWGRKHERTPSDLGSAAVVGGEVVPFPGHLAELRGQQPSGRHAVESARFVDCLEIGYPYAHISCCGARAVTGGEHGGRLTLSGSCLLKRTPWSPPSDPGGPPRL